MRIVAEPWRQRQIARLGEKTWKGIHALLALAGFALIVYGFGQARRQPLVDVGGAYISPGSSMGEPLLLPMLGQWIEQFIAGGVQARQEGGEGAYL